MPNVGNIIGDGTTQSQSAHGRTAFPLTLLKGLEHKPRGLRNNKLLSYYATHRTIKPMVCHDNHHNVNNRAAVSHELTL